MNTILTEYDVAELLSLNHDHVTKMFQTGVISGFKIGGSWRIEASQLSINLKALIGIQDPSMATAKNESYYQAVRSKRPQKNIPIVVENPHPLPEEKLGQLLVSTDAPGVVVKLDDEVKGKTPISIVNIPVGFHQIQVGHQMAEIEILRDLQLQVGLIRDDLQVLPAQDNPLEIQPQVQTVRLSIDLINESGYTGEFDINLTGEKGLPNSILFESVSNHRTSNGLKLSRQIESYSNTPLFNELVHVRPGDRLYVTVPKQESLKATQEKVLVVQGDVQLIITLSAKGFLGSRGTVKFKVKSS
jgi:hypothetical protein